MDDAIERCGKYGRFQWFILCFSGINWMSNACQVKRGTAQASSRAPRAQELLLARRRQRTPKPGRMGQNVHAFAPGLPTCPTTCRRYQVMLLTFLGRAVKCEWNVTAAQLGVLVSVVFAGMSIGGPLWGCISDGWGRRTSFIMSLACTTVFGFASAAAGSFAQLLACRFFVGVGIQGASVSYSLLTEFVPAASRGFFLVAIEGFWTLGTIVQAALAHRVLDHYGW